MDIKITKKCSNPIKSAHSGDGGMTLEEGNDISVNQAFLT